jgi:hypothetical protein
MKTFKAPRDIASGWALDVDGVGVLGVCHWHSVLPDIVVEQDGVKVRKVRADYVNQNPTRDRKYAKLIEALTGADKVIFQASKRNEDDTAWTIDKSQGRNGYKGVFEIRSVVIGADGWIEFEILKQLGPLETYAPVTHATQS